MRTLNKESTEMFCLLIEKLNGKQHLKIENEPFMPLVIEKIGEAYDGEALLFSLCHYYKQNGDLMQDPEVCFVFIDGRTGDSSGYEHVQIIPYSFEQANLGIYQVSITFYCGVVEHCDEQMQNDHTVFAEGWLKNILAQGFIQA
ncbi:hypothetical protein FHW88_003346 [Mucilaginibacter sp. SG538B]|uniref:DUF6908 domain-containing protein n=1 Tax=Mucilaginibacter sp. SG538B TaxID=2587021 RepID=UPI00159CFE8E|nr:hypothetical protein [Mucilaginibacter sp. SG538B]NVM65042.1 hypothetical protein [Mucilaginibacter sp. SG538B]